MKKSAARWIVAVCVPLALAAGGPAFAQETKKERQEKRGRQQAERFFRVDLEKLRAQLSLSPQQDARLRELFRETAEELRELRQSSEKARVVEERLGILRREKVDQFLALLSDEQRDALTKGNKKLARRLKRDGKAKQGWKQLFDPAVLKARLGLDAEQLARVKRTLRGIDLDLKALRATYSDDRPRLRKEVQLLRQEVFQDLLEGLSPEQQQTLREVAGRGRKPKKKRKRWQRWFGFKGGAQ